jgi:hypothetical protein
MVIKISYLLSNGQLQSVEFPRGIKKITISEDDKEQFTIEEIVRDAYQQRYYVYKPRVVLEQEQQN